MANSNKRSSRRTKRPFQMTIFRDVNIARNPVAIRKVVLSIQGTIGSNGSGVIAGSIAMDPSGSNEWSSFAAIYDQFRVIGGVMNLMSARGLGDTAANCIVRFAFDNDSTGTPASYGAVAQYSEITDVPAVWSGGAVKKVAFKRPYVKGVPQSQYVWYDEATPSASPGSIKYYGSGASNTITYYSYILDFVVEFQMRG